MNSSLSYLNKINMNEYIPKLCELNSKAIKDEYTRIRFNHLGFKQAKQFLCI